jgi:hypothetical protein
MGFGRGALLWLLGVPLADHFAARPIVAPLDSTDFFGLFGSRPKQADLSFAANSPLRWDEAVRK